MSRLLVLAETDGAQILPTTLPALSFAQQYATLTGGDFDLLLIGGPEIAAHAESWRGFSERQVYVVTSLELAHPTAESIAAVCLEAMNASGANALAGTSSAFGRDVLPRVAALKDFPMLSDVLQIASGANGLQFQRPMYAGNVIATVAITGDSGVFSVRGTAFDAPTRSDSTTPTQSLPAPSAVDGGSRWVSMDAPEQKRPELTTARVIVSGGRPLRDAATFERLLGGLADKLGGAVGATRAAVDSGIAPNELQIGQTGKVVAPDLYIAAGVSGSVQHLAGMKESKVIVAINTDPDAPIFQVADYGLVADLYQAIPELMEKLA